VGISGVGKHRCYQTSSELGSDRKQCQIIVFSVGALGGDRTNTPNHIFLQRVCIGGRLGTPLLRYEQTNHPHNSTGWWAVPEGDPTKVGAPKTFHPFPRVGELYHAGAEGEPASMRATTCLGGGLPTLVHTYIYIYMWVSRLSRCRGFIPGPLCKRGPMGPWAAMGRHGPHGPHGAPWVPWGPLGPWGPVYVAFT